MWGLPSGALILNIVNVNLLLRASRRLLRRPHRQNRSRARGEDHVVVGAGGALDLAQEEVARQAGQRGQRGHVRVRVNLEQVGGLEARGLEIVQPNQHEGAHGQEVAALIAPGELAAQPQKQLVQARVGGHMEHTVAERGSHQRVHLERAGRHTQTRGGRSAVLVLARERL